MAEIGVIKAKAHFPELLERVAAGESITIMRDGEAVVCQVPPPNRHRADTGTPKLVAQ
jgi:antitoxin (DNA-binding transcriptional repressor) of toxin-antitoxin stability system